MLFIDKKNIQNTCKVINLVIHLPPLNQRNLCFRRRGAGEVTEQIANLSAGNRRQGSSPCLSANL